MSRKDVEESGLPGSLGFSRPAPNTEGRSQTLKHYEALKKEDNPYDPYLQPVAASGGDGESVDDGINMDVSSSHSDIDNTDNFLMSSTPGADIVMMKFDEFLEVNSPMRDSEEDSFRRMSIEEKWKQVCKQKPHAPIYDASYYIRELTNHGGATKRRRSWGRSSRDSLTSLSFILRKLKGDLHMAYSSFLHQFITLGGVQALARVLNEIQSEQQAGKKSKVDLFKQLMQDEYDCLLCIKFTRKLEESLLQVTNMATEFECIVQCLYSSHVKTRIVALQIMCSVCEVTGGFTQVVECLSKLHIKNRDMMKFHTLVTMLNKRDNIRFQIWSVRFFNCLWKCTQVTNAKVYLQYELEQAGFDPDALDRYGLDRGPEFEELQKELDLWRQNYISVAGSTQELVELENRNTYLRQEIDRQNERIKECQEKLEAEKKSHASIKDKCDQYRERAAELQDTVEKLTTMYKDRTGEEPDSSAKIDEVTRPLDIYGTLKSVQVKRSRSRAESMKEAASPGSVSSNINKPRPSLPLPPPPFIFKSQTVTKKFLKSSSSNMPTFQFVHLHTVTNSLFEDIDDEAKLREIDFSDFEQRFKLNTPAGPSKNMATIQRMMRRSADKITVIDTDRARNMIITQRRIGKKAHEICEAIDKCDMDAFPEAMTEQMLNYIPTKDEIKRLREYDTHYNELGEAEQFLFQLMQVERLESKLTAMVFMEIFDELSSSAAPEIDMINRNSQNVLQCTKLKGIFEIILAFGNYMNSNKKGYVLGFKLESLKKLSELRSTQDKTVTFLHYLEEFISVKYPELHQFYEELDLEIEKGVSYQAIYSDVVGLRKGLDQIKFEMDRQPGNRVIADFYRSGSSLVTEIADSFHNMEKVYEKVCLMFGENYKAAETEDIFRPLMDFCADFERAGRENYKRMHPDSPSVRSPKETPRSTPSTPPGNTLSKSFPGNQPTYSNTEPQISKTTSRSNSNRSMAEKQQPMYSNLEPPVSKSNSRSSSKTFTFEKPQLKHVASDNRSFVEPEEDYYDDVVTASSTTHMSSASIMQAQRMHQTEMAANHAVASMVQIPTEILQQRRNISELSQSSQDTNASGDFKVSTSHSKMFPAVKKSNSIQKSKSSATRVKKESTTENIEHRPVIKQSNRVTKQKEDMNARKLPRVPIDTDSETYYNVHSKLGRVKSTNSPRTNILPDKPSVTKPAVSKSSFREPAGANLYEDIPYDRQNGVHKKEQEFAPPVPVKTEDAYISKTGSLKRKAPKPPAPVPPATIGNDKGPPTSPNDKQYTNQVSQVLNELNEMLDMNGPTSPVSISED